jgi:hypothetical protein
VSALQRRITCVTHAGRSAENEPGPEFIGGIDLEAVFSGSVCHVR